MEFNCEKRVELENVFQRLSRLIDHFSPELKSQTPLDGRDSSFPVVKIKIKIKVKISI